MNFEDLTTGLGGNRFRPDLDPDITGVVRDNREVHQGDLFAALVGGSVDATRFVPAAIEAGAAALLLDERGTLPSGAAPDELPVPSVVVPNGRAALAQLAHRFFGYPFEEVTTVAVTGTNGKTTTALMLESIFAAAGRACGVIGTIFFRLGMWEIHGHNTTPESLDLASLLRAYIDRGASAVVLEASSHGLEMHRLDGAHFDVGVFTNLSTDHLDYHGDMESYFSAKRRLFTSHLPESRRAGKLGVAVINRDDPYGRQLLKEKTGPTVSFGLTEESDVHATNTELRDNGTAFDLRLTSGETCRVNLPMVGMHNVLNAVGAAAAAEACSIPATAIVNGLKQLPSVRGRVERAARTDGTGPVVFVDYAHTPDALEQVLLSLRELSTQPVWVVFGCGGDRDRSKRLEMGRVAATLADCAILTSDNPRSEDPLDIIASVQAGIVSSGAVELEALTVQSRGFVVIEDRHDAITSAILAAGDRTLVLVAGKGHESTQEIMGTKVPFDDLDVARMALGSWESGEVNL